MAIPRTGAYRFGNFEAHAATGELRRAGMRIRLAEQPFQLLLLLLDRPGTLLTREEICQELWPEGTFVDFDHGVNSAINRIREALGDRAAHPRFIETLAKRGYRLLVPVERLSEAPPSQASASAFSALPQGSGPQDGSDLPAVPGDSQPQARQTGSFRRKPALLASQADLPATPQPVVLALFVALQLMYLAFYVGALANFAEIGGLLDDLRWGTSAFLLVMGSAALLIPARLFLLCAASFAAPGFGRQALRLWPVLLMADLLWALAPFLLVHHISAGLALACTAVLLYAPFAQRSLVLMGAGAPRRRAADSVMPEPPLPR